MQPLSHVHLTHKVLSLSSMDLPDGPFLRNLTLKLDESLL
jgi:hypothetical protein